MTPIVEALGRVAALLTYPGYGYGRDLDALAARVRGLDPAAATALAEFGRYVGGASIEGLQEAFTQTFDLNPVCALEVGWQLFGEEYERGTFMVEMRRLLREHGVPERGELPDHLSSLLTLLPRLPAADARTLASDALVPAVAKMRHAIEESDSSFRPLMQAIDRLVAVCAEPAPEVTHV